MSDEFDAKHCGEAPKLASTQRLQWASLTIDHFGACDTADTMLHARLAIALFGALSWRRYLCVRQTKFARQELLRVISLRG